MSSETLAFMQDTVTLVAKLSSIGGSTYILDGCEESGDKVSAGTLVIDGEVLPYEGGLTSSKISVQEVKNSVQVYDKTYGEIYITRKAVASSTAGARPFSGFSRLPNLQTLASSVVNIDSTLTRHINNHTVAWDKVDGKPSAYPPAEHGHDWEKISGKPDVYPPAAHTHGGCSVIYVGEFNAKGDEVTKLFGSITVSVAHLNGGQYQLTHNLGHTNYLIAGVGVGYVLYSLRSMQDIKENTVIVNVSDDGTRNDCPIRFSITTW